MVKMIIVSLHRSNYLSHGARGVLAVLWQRRPHNININIVRWLYFATYILSNSIDFCLSNKFSPSSSSSLSLSSSSSSSSASSSASSSSSLSSSGMASMYYDSAGGWASRTPSSGVGTGSGSGSAYGSAWGLGNGMGIGMAMGMGMGTGSTSNSATSSVVSAFEPDFVIPLENVTVAQGRDATFTCVVNNLGGHRVSGDSTSPPRVAWIKADAKAILAIHEHVITNNDRLTVTHNDYNTWTLNIRNVKMEDAGKYMCQVNTDPMKMQTAVLEVVIPPDIVNEETSGDMMVPEGGSAKLVCRARGHPKPKITWRREDGREIIARNGAHQKTKALAVEGEMLTLSKVTRSEMGAYMCIASNGVPPSVSKRMKLQVHFHPLVQVPNQLVGAPVLTHVTLICNVEASPKAINYWQRENGEMIIAGDRYILTEKEVNMYAIEMILHIKRLQTTDFGGYKCISKNSIGDTEGTIRLYEMEHQGRKPLREEDLNEVTKNEIVLKENRHEESGSSRNQNGRLYKERGTDANIYNYAPSQMQLTRQMINLIMASVVTVMVFTNAIITTAKIEITTTLMAAIISISLRQHSQLHTVTLRDTNNYHYAS